MPQYELQFKLGYFDSAGAFMAIKTIETNSFRLVSSIVSEAQHLLRELSTGALPKGHFALVIQNYGHFQIVAVEKRHGLEPTGEFVTVLDGKLSTEDVAVLTS